MATFSWLEALKSAQKSALVQDGKKKIHFTFPDRTEMAEEYDVKTGDLLVRKWKKKKMLGGDGNWEFEVGEQYFTPTAMKEDLLRESSSNPIFVRKDTKECFQWRIRNLPYPVSTYSVTADNDARCCIVRTTNKKYYKRFSIPDLDRAQLPLEQSAVSFAHANNTLIISYKKPPEIYSLEKEIKAELQKLKAMKDGDLECNPS
ncbi:Protein DPCD [Holothuria leucospilota]|uniref:Protein DPCD n=1 Tax=Holothuria leucospilota TaxID=206669 RepID=A0A9Q0YRK7_HOLLE|nr:Protein DPCD [Holothuria leucospilota]